MESWHRLLRLMLDETLNFEQAQAWEWAERLNLIYPNADNEIDFNSPITLNDLMIVLLRFYNAIR